MTLNALCFESLCQDCARLAIEHGYEDLADPTHPLRAELDELNAYDLLRIATFIQGVQAMVEPPEEDEVRPGRLGSLVALTFLLGLALIAIFAIRFLFRI